MSLRFLTYRRAYGNPVSNMSPQDFVILTATIRDLNRLTELHCSSFRPRDNIPMLLGKRYVMSTYRWLVTSDMTYVLVAEGEGRIKGLVAVADRSFSWPMFKACMGAFFFSILIHPSLILERRLWRRLFRKPELSSQGRYIAEYPGLAQMTIGAVDSKYRGQGIFDALVKATCPHSAARGSRAIRAGVYKSNLSSRRVFVKCNWIETRSLETADTIDYVYYLDPTFRRDMSLLAAE